MGCPLADAVAGTTSSGLVDLPGPRPDLTANQKGNEYLVMVRHVVSTGGQVVLVAAVTVSSTVRVVFKEVDRTSCDPLFGEALLCALIVLRVDYTEIDWVAYMEEVGGFLGGERNYLNLRGGTVRLLPFLCLFLCLFHPRTKGPKNRRSFIGFVGLNCMK